MHFAFAERPSDSPFIETIWHTRSEHGGDFTSCASSYSEIVVARSAGQITVTVRGPETTTTPALAPADGEFLGIVLKLGTFLPTLLPKHLANRRDAALPVINQTAFWLENAAWEIPTFDNADTFVARLVRAGLLAHDPLVGAALHGDPPALSPRALQYRFVRATGLSYKLIQQIERARQAVALLQRGIPISDTAYAVGYYDQSHLTNSVKRFLGQTPAQIARMNQAA